MSFSSIDAMVLAKTASPPGDPGLLAHGVRADDADHTILATLQKRARKDGSARGAVLQMERPVANDSVTAYIGLYVVCTAFARVREIETRIRALHQVIECHAVSGDFNYLLKIAAPDISRLSEFMNGRLMQVPGIACMRSMVCLEEIKRPVSHGDDKHRDGDRARADRSSATPIGSAR